MRWPLPLMLLRVFRARLLVPLYLPPRLQAPQCSLSLQVPALLVQRSASPLVIQLPLLPHHLFLDNSQQVPQHPLHLGSSPPARCPLPPLPHRLPALLLVPLLLAPPLLGALVSQRLDKHRPLGNQRAVLRVVLLLASLGLGQCQLLASQRLPRQPPAAATFLEHRLAPTAPAPSPLDSHLPAREVGCLAKAALWCLGRTPDLGKEDPSLVALLPSLLPRHLLGSASARLQVRTNLRETQDIF